MDCWSVLKFDGFGEVAEYYCWICRLLHYGPLTWRLAWCREALSYNALQFPFLPIVIVIVIIIIKILIDYTGQQLDRGGERSGGWVSGHYLHQTAKTLWERPQSSLRTCHEVEYVVLSVQSSLCTAMGTTSSVNQQAGPISLALFNNLLHVNVRSKPSNSFKFRLSLLSVAEFF